jgi:hypothetical protein
MKRKSIWVIVFVAVFSFCSRVALAMAAQDKYTARVSGGLVNVDFMGKDSKRFADSGGWGYAVFDYDAASDTFTPGTLAGTPPQGNDAKGGFACHTRVKTRDYVFTEYGRR